MNVFHKNREIPKVVILNKNLENSIGSWLGCKKNIVREFGKVLFNIGFKTTDEIVLCMYDKKRFSFTYFVNGANPYGKNKIWLSYGENEDKPKIIVTSGSNETKTVVSYEGKRNNKKKISDKFIVTYYSKEDREKCYYRCYKINEAVFRVCKGDYELEFSVREPYDLFATRNNDEMYVLKNERLLVDYLTGLSFPVRIDEVYKKICEISLGDISMYPEFSLKIVKTNEDTYEDEIKDIITLTNGNLVNFGMTKNGKTVLLNELDGSWSYETSVLDSKAIVQYEDDKFIYGMIYGQEVLEDEVMLSDLKTTALDEVAKTRKLVKNIFNGKSK